MTGGRYVVSVIIPCYNEEKSIANVLRGFYKGMLGKDAFDFDLIVINNNSTDRTAAVAKQAGARVIDEPRKGKGYAMRTGFDSVRPDADFVVMLDGDNTYRPEEVVRMLEPLVNNFCDVVVGSRLGGRVHGDAMPFVNRGGNWIFTHMVRLIYKVNVTDVLSGYFAWKRETLQELATYIHSTGFAIEMEMITKMARMHCQVNSVPISYHPRGGQTNLKPFADGRRIMNMLFKNMRWHPVPAVNLELEKDEV